MKKTRQGVRDLNSLPAKSAGRKLEDPPIVIMCKHVRQRPAKYTGGSICEDCGEEWDWNGMAL